MVKSSIWNELSTGSKAFIMILIGILGAGVIALLYMIVIGNFNNQVQTGAISTDNFTKTAINNMSTSIVYAGNSAVSAAVTPFSYANIIMLVVIFGALIGGGLFLFGRAKKGGGL